MLQNAFNTYEELKKYIYFIDRGNQKMIKQLLEGVIGQKEALNELNATIVYKILPMEVNGYVFNYKGINCIVINNSLSDYKKRKTILHELAHIELNHLCQIDNDLFEFYVEKREDEADKYIKFIKESLNK